MGYQSQTLKKGILCLVLLSIAFSFYAQVPGVKTYTQLDGYPGSVGYLIFQDNRGFIWVGTDKGVAVFDGQKFRTLDDRDGLLNKEIISAYPVCNDRVVFTPLLNNISFYEKGKIITSEQEPKLNLIKNKNLNVIKVDVVTGKYWLSDVGESQNLFSVSCNSITQHTLKFKNSYTLLNVFDDKLTFGVDTNYGGKWIYFFDNKTKKYQVLKTISDEVVVKKHDPVFSSDGRIFLIKRENKKNIKCYEVTDEYREKLISVVETKKNPYLFKVDRNNNLWTAYPDGGVDFWGKIDSTINKRTPFRLLDNTIVTDFFIDREGNVWVSTMNGGFLFITAKHWQNALLTSKMGLTELKPRTIVGDGKNTYLMSFYKENILLGYSNGKKVSIHIKNSLKQGFRCLLVHNNTVFTSSNNKINAVGFKNGITKGFKEFVYLGAVKDISVYDEKRILVASHIDASIVATDFSAEKKIYNGRTLCIERNDDGEVFIGTPNGLYLTTGFNGKPKKVLNTVLNKAFISELLNTENGYTLIGTSVSGLYKYEFKTKKIEKVLFPNSIQLGQIQQIYKQNDSVYWLATDRGANQVFLTNNFKVKKTNTYTFFDGLPSDNVTGVYVKDDTAYITTPDGLGILSLNSKNKEPIRSPLVYITQAQTIDSTIYFPHKIVVQPSQNTIQFSLSTISYSSFDNIHYSYQLKGLGDEWIETESPHLSFSNLAPGDYTLKVFSVNHLGIKSENPYTVYLEILPAFWQTWWFTLLVFILGVALLSIGIYKLLLRSKNRQYQKLQQKRRLAELELEAIKAQINPHFIYNCLNSIQYFNYKREYDLSRQYLDLFAKLIRQTMQYSQETFITLAEDIDYLENYLKLEKIRFKEKLKYSIVVGQGINTHRVIPSMLVQPYVENALKHGVAKIKNTGSIFINYQLNKDKELQITIEDNGPGLETGKTTSIKKALGLRLSGSRATTYNELFSTEIKITFKKAQPEDINKGTIVTLTIPNITNENTKL